MLILTRVRILCLQAQATHWAGILVLERTKQFIIIGKLANFIINRSFAFSSMAPRRSSREQREEAGFAQSGMASTDCERNFQGISSIKEGHLPLQQRALQTKGRSGLGFPSILALQWKFLLFMPWLWMLLPEAGSSTCVPGEGGRKEHWVSCPLGDLPSLQRRSSALTSSAGSRLEKEATWHPGSGMSRTLLRCRHSLLLFIAISPKLWRVLIRGWNDKNQSLQNFESPIGLWTPVTVQFANNSNEPFSWRWREGMRFWYIWIHHASQVKRLFWTVMFPHQSSFPAKVPERVTSHGLWCQSSHCIRGLSRQPVSLCMWPDHYLTLHLFSNKSP